MEERPITASEMGKRRMAALTAEERRSLASKAGRASVAKLTPEQLKARGRAGAAKREANRIARSNQ